uniref:Uncharacterized protein n=1 Tax=Glossina morsitans morsitans TaxID=37546 RepID=A0A1B0FB52_GLOMM
MLPILDEKQIAGKFYNDEKLDKGLQTSQDARFYAISKKFGSFCNKDKPLVVQFFVKHEQNIDCGGGYVKLFDCKLDQSDMHDESPYEIMFGPNICGPGTKKVHAIFSYKGKNHLIKKNVRCKDDAYRHFYTPIYTPKKIKDPAAKKPDNWDDKPNIADPDDKKPEDWDKPEQIPDPDATKPEDWDDETDREWEPLMVDNPDGEKSMKEAQDEEQRKKDEEESKKGLDQEDEGKDDLLKSDSSKKHDEL